MRKILAIIISLFILTLLFSGCGSLPAADPAAAAENTEGSETAPVEQTGDAPEEAEEKYEPVTIRIGGLKGPTSIGMVKLLEDAENGLTLNNYEFTMAAAADELTPKLLKGELDILAVPANLASILYNRSEGGVKMAAVNTLGVIYIVEKGGETVNSIQDLKGRTIYTTGKGATPEYTLNYILQANGLDPEKDVTVEYMSEAAEIGAQIAAGNCEIALAPQPYATAIQVQNEGWHVALSMNDAWNAVNSESGLISGCIVVQKAFAEAHPEVMARFMEAYAASVEWVNANAADAGQLDVFK